MDFDFSDDQEMLRDTVRKWVEKSYDFERRRAIVKAGGFSPEAWDELAELGLLGLHVPEDARRHGHRPGRRDGGDGRARPRHRAGAAWPQWRWSRRSCCAPATRPWPRPWLPGHRPAARRWSCWRRRNARRATASTPARPRPRQEGGRLAAERHEDRRAGRRRGRRLHRAGANPRRVDDGDGSPSSSSRSGAPGVAVAATARRTAPRGRSRARRTPTATTARRRRGLAALEQARSTSASPRSAPRPSARWTSWSR